MESSLIYGMPLGKAVTQSSCINNQKPDIFGILDLEEPHLHNALEHNARESNIIYYVWIYENRANVNTTILTLSSKKIHSLFHSINHRQSVNTQPTHQPCLCLAGWLPAAKPAGHG